MRTGLHHTGVELEGREGEACFESPTEAESDSPAIMAPIILPKQEYPSHRYLHCMDQDKEERRYLH